MVRFICLKRIVYGASRTTKRSDPWYLAPTPKETPVAAHRPKASKDAESPGGDCSLRGLSYPRVSGNGPVDGPLAFERTRLPPQSFLPVGIGEWPRRRPIGV